MNPVKCLKSFKFAFRGIWLVLHENNSRFHLAATLLAILLGVFWELESGQWLWVLAAVFSVWIAETFNTALEKLTDLVSPDFHPLAGKVKDLAAGCVLLASLFAVLVGMAIFLPKIIYLFNGESG